MIMSLDTETTGLSFWHGCRPFFVSIATDEDKTCYWQWDVSPKTRRIDKRQVKICIPEILEYLKRADKIIFHNTKFDVRALETIGIDFLPFWDKVEDTLVASHVINSGELHGLKPLAESYLGISSDDEKAIKKQVLKARRQGNDLGWRIAKAGDVFFPGVGKDTTISMADCWLPTAVAKHFGYPSDHPYFTSIKEYGVLDAVRTIALWFVFEEGMRRMGTYELYKIRKRTLQITYEMETYGVTVSQKLLNAEYKKRAKVVDRTKRKCQIIAPNVSLSSPKQLRELLFDRWQLPSIKTTKGGEWSTNNESLLAVQIEAEGRQREFLDNLMEHRQNIKALEYLTSYKTFGILKWLRYFIHSNYNVTGTRTTRFSSSMPNMQNVGKKSEMNLRAVFGPSAGREWYAIDYENIELRIFAYACGDEKLIGAFKRGESVHLLVAAAVYPALLDTLGPDAFKKTEEYKQCKSGTFSMIYGASKDVVNSTYGVRDAHSRIVAMFPLISVFIKDIARQAKLDGYVTTLGGYPLRVASNEPHKACNYFVQGSAGWLMLRALIDVYDYLKKYDSHYVIAPIHDELLFDFPKKKSNIPRIRRVARIMREAGKYIEMDIPVSIERIQTVWSEGESVVI